MSRPARGEMKRLISCEGKERYNTFGRAEAVATRRANNKGGKLAAYRCQFCGGVHIGNNLRGRNGDSAADGADPRQRYVVLAIGPDGREISVGYSNDIDGGAVARRVRETAGWAISRIIDRKPSMKLSA